MKVKKLNIAIVGSGVAGLTAAYLLNKKHTVTVFEKNDYVGGHTHTIVIPDGPDAGTPVDTGFIVMNHLNYPLFTRLLSLLGVKLRDSDMSFGYFCEQTGLQYSSRGLNGLYAQRKNFVNPTFQRMVYDIFRFYRNAKDDLKTGAAANFTLGEYLKSKNFSEYFIAHHIIPMGAAIWSTPDEEMMEFPALSFFNFLNNHKLLGITGQPLWKTVIGGSHTYVKAIRASLHKDVIINSPVTSIARQKGAVKISTGKKRTTFDAVIIATHADEALTLLADPTPDEKRLLGPWRYQKNRTVLHTDEHLMPTNKNASASWNFIRNAGQSKNAPLTLTYDMNRLQGLKTVRRYFVTLNSARPIPEDQIIASMDYYHPTYTFASMNTQKELHILNGTRGTFFCGSYFGYGFHEDAVRSGVEVARMMGCDL